MEVEEVIKEARDAMTETSKQAPPSKDSLCRKTPLRAYPEGPGWLTSPRFLSRPG
jgi:hypothetical protein